MADQARFAQFSDARPIRRDEALGLDRGADSQRLRLVPLAALTPDDQSRWNALGEQARFQSAFAQPWFVRPSLTHCDGAGEARLAVVEDRRGAWLGVLPLTQAWRYGRVPFPHWQAWRHPNMFSGSPLVRAGSERAFWQGLIAGLDARSASRPALRLPDLPSDEASTQALLALCQEQNRPIKFDRVRSRAMLAASIEPPAPKPDLRRRLASLERKIVSEVGALEFSAHRDSEMIGGLIEGFLHLERSGWKGQAGSALSCDAANESFFRAVIAAAADAGALEFSTLHAGGRLLAMSAHFVAQGGWSHGFKSAFAEDFAAFAPGVLLLHRLTGHFAASGYLPFDSCSAPEQQPIGKLWPARREFVDCGVALGGTAGWAAFRALAFCEEVAHRHKAMATGNA